MIDRILPFIEAARDLIVKWWKVGLACIAAVLLAYVWGQHVGRKAADSEWNAAMARLTAQAVERARQADAQRTAEVQAATDHITQAREDLDNATRNLPDESPSARRRLRICNELREQARRNSAPAPAC